MCGQRVPSTGRPRRRTDPVSDETSRRSPPASAAPSQPRDPSTGHKFRDSSPDRRVYTSALGQSVPSGLADALEAARKRRRATPVRGVRPEGSADEVKPVDAAEPTRKVKPRRPLLSRARLRRPQRPGLVHEVVQSLLWALLLSTLGGLVAWGVYVGLRRGTHDEVAAQPAAPPPAPKAAPAPRPRPVSRPAPRPAGHDLVIPVPAAAGALQSASPPPTPVGSAAVPPPAAAPPPAALAPVVHDKSLDDIEFVASNHSPQVRACYDRAFRHAGAQAPAGRVELSFALVDTGEFGRAIEITTELNMLAEPSVSTCLEERIAEWHFPRPRPLPTAPGAPPRRLRYPFVFTPAPP